MRNFIYISGISGVVLLFLRLIGSSYNHWILLTGIVLIFGVCLPLSIIYHFQKKKNFRSIITSYRKNGKKDISPQKKLKNQKGPNYPSFRDKKSGLKWGGGNIHGANATRPSKRSFLKM